jgi:phosphopentomutase
MPRGIIIVMDSVGIGHAPDAEAYGDKGADTVGHIAAACDAGECDTQVRRGPLNLPHLAARGLNMARGMAAGQPCARPPHGIAGGYGFATERSRGKDTPSGHWEIAGVPVPFAWGYFPRSLPCFPADLI